MQICDGLHAHYAFPLDECNYPATGKVGWRGIVRPAAGFASSARRGHPRRRVGARVTYAWHNTFFIPRSLAISRRL